MRCDECKHWKRIESNGEYLYPHGRCNGLPNENFEVEIDAGYHDGVVGCIETKNDFFCAAFANK